VAAVAWNTVSKRLCLTASWDGAVKIWDANAIAARGPAAATPVAALAAAHGGAAAYAADWHPRNDRLIASAGGDHRVVLWDINGVLRVRQRPLPRPRTPFLCVRMRASSTVAAPTRLMRSLPRAETDSPESNTPLRCSTRSTSVVHRQRGGRAHAGLQQVPRARGADGRRGHAGARVGPAADSVPAEDAGGPQAACAPRALLPMGR
jgi:hypothetical protein